MFRTAPLQVTRLEDREVPSAAMFTDIHPGVWGSYPMNLTPSGSTLFFSADDGHGYELYATDGTSGSAHMVKDIKPGLGGSDPWSFVAAGNGIVYFIANDGAGAALWRSDGTATGTAKVPGISQDAIPGQAIGLNGDLYYLGATGSSSVGWWKTNGTAPTLLKDFGPSVINGYYNLALEDGQVTVTPYVNNAAQTVWTTDGTLAGTKPRLQNLTTMDPTLGTVNLLPGVELSPGKFLFIGQRTDFSGTVSGDSLWIGDAQNPASRTLIKSFAMPAASLGLTNFAVVGDKAYFFVASGTWPRPAATGLWVTDGTAAGTHKVDLPAGLTPNQSLLAPFAGGLLIQSPGTGLYGMRFWLTDGTAGGTRELTDPDGVGGQLSFGRLIPPGPGAPNGALVLNENGRLFQTDGTAAGTFWVDVTGVPTGLPPKGNLPPDVVVFNGALYFASANGEQRSELWRWDLGGPVQTPPVGPKATSVVVNDGSAQRSMVTSLTVAFDRPVNLDDGAISVRDATGKLVPIYLTPTSSAGGETIVITFGTASGGSLSDGRYTLTVTAAKVHDADTGAAMSADYSFAVARLFGDLNGDGLYDREARTMVHSALGQRAGDAGYLAALDVNRDGVIDAIDEMAVVRNWGKSV